MNFDIEMLAADCNALNENTSSIDRSAWFENMAKRVAALHENFSELRKFMQNNHKLFYLGGAYGYSSRLRAYTDESRIEMNENGWTFRSCDGATYEWYQFSTDLSYITEKKYSAIPPERMRFVADEVDLLERMWTDEIPKTVREYLNSLRDKAIALNNDVRKMALVNRNSEKVKRIVISVEM